MEPIKNASATQASGRGKEKGFIIPSLSEIKKASKVSVISSSPILFNKTRPPSQTNLTTHDSSSTTPQPPHILPTVVGSSHTSTILQSSGPTSGTDSLNRTGAVATNNVLNGGNFMTGSRKRGREVNSDEGKSKKLPATINERGSLDKDGLVVEHSAHSSIHAIPIKAVDPEPSSVGLSSSATTSTISTTVHHPHAIIANIVQKKNPLMKHIRNVPWELGDIIPDFVLGKTTCAMFLSIRYHSLHPNYIHSRLKTLGKQYQLRILLVLVDMKENQKASQELAKIAILADLTLMLAWSYEEAGRYLETYKAFENKPPDMLMERVDSDFFSRATECLTAVKKVNKTDAATLLNNFKTLDKVITASKDELVLCPGLGPQKAQRLYTLFHQPFKNPKTE